MIKEFKNVRLGVLPAGGLDSISNISAALLESTAVARVDPENPRVGRFISNLMTVLDSKLRFSVPGQLVSEAAIQRRIVPTLPHPAPQARPWLRVVKASS